jgi:hypothetical protein
VPKRLLAGVAAAVLVGLSGCAFATSEPARSVAVDHATVDGIFFSTRSFGSVEVTLEWGKTAAYGQRERIGYLNATAKPDEYDLATKLRGLEAATTYHFRICAGDDDNTANPGCSGDRTFTTPATNAPLLTLLPECWNLNRSVYDTIHITASGLPPGSPGPPPTGPVIGFEVARDGGAFQPAGATRADRDGDLDFGKVGFSQDVNRFDVRMFLDPNFNGKLDQGEQLLATGSAQSNCTPSAPTSAGVRVQAARG